MIVLSCAASTCLEGSVYLDGAPASAFELSELEAAAPSLVLGGLCCVTNGLRMGEASESDGLLLPSDDKRVCGGGRA